MVATLNITCWQGTIVSCHNDIVEYDIISSHRNGAETSDTDGIGGKSIKN